MRKDKLAISSVRDIILACFTEKLDSYNYNSDDCDELVKSLSDSILEKLQGLRSARYKYVVQVLVGERREQGLR